MSKPDIAAQVARKNKIATKQDIIRVIRVIQQSKENYPNFSKKDVLSVLSVLRRYVLNVGGDLPWPPTVEAWAPGEQIAHKALYYTIAAAEGIHDVADGITQASDNAPEPAPSRPRRHGGSSTGRM